MDYIFLSWVKHTSVNFTYNANLVIAIKVVVGKVIFEIALGLFKYDISVFLAILDPLKY